MCEHWGFVQDCRLFLVRVTCYLSLARKISSKPVIENGALADCSAVEGLAWPLPDGEDEYGRSPIHRVTRKRSSSRKLDSPRGETRIKIPHSIRRVE